ncbi:MAG: type II toxin-antitoxin system VapC family toxin [Chloroherpetonaceae bacterium]
MTVLCDTQSYIWAVENDPRLTEKARDTLGQLTIEKYLSIGSVWEMTIKVSIGKLQLQTSIEEMIEKSLAENAIRLLDIKLSHLKTLQSLPYYHRDPFDRLIVAQALSQGLPIVSSDANLNLYGVTRIW